MNEQHSLSPSIPTEEVPLSKALNPQLLAECRNKNGYPLLQVCVCSLLTAPNVCAHLNGLNAENGLLYLVFTSLHAIKVVPHGHKMA